MPMLPTHMALLPGMVRYLPLGPMLLASLSAPAQTISPALPIQGSTVTLSFPTLPPSLQNPSPTVTLSGPNFSTSPAPVYANGVTSYTTPPLPAGLYLVTEFVLGDSPGQEFFYSVQVYNKDAAALNALQGQYTFQVSGQAASSASGPKAAAGAGSFTADGNGNITAGVIDLNTPDGVETAAPVTGAYRFNAYGIGQISLVTSQGTLQLAVLGQPLFSAKLVQIETGLSYASPVSTYLTGGALSTNAGGLVSSAGRLVQTNPPLNPNYPSFTNPFLPALNGIFAASISGEQPDSVTPVSGAGQFQFATNGSVANNATLFSNGSSFTYSGLPGTSTAFDMTTGRGSVTFTGTNHMGASPENYAVYQLTGGSGFFFISTTPRSQAGLLFGQAGTY